MDREALVKKIETVLPGGIVSFDYRRAIAEDVIATIESAGLKIMGREPDEAMILDGSDCICCGDDDFIDGFRAAWDAAPTYTDKGEGE